MDYMRDIQIESTYMLEDRTYSREIFIKNKIKLKFTHKGRFLV